MFGEALILSKNAEYFFTCNFFKWKVTNHILRIYNIPTYNPQHFITNNRFDRKTLRVRGLSECLSANHGSLSQAVGKCASFQERNASGISQHALVSPEGADMRLFMPRFASAAPWGVKFSTNYEYSQVTKREIIATNGKKIGKRWNSKHFGFSLTNDIII